jgi:hypothetical protein
LSEVGILGQEAVAGMDRLRAGLLGGGDDTLADQIAFACRRGPDVHRFIGHADVQRSRVRIGVDRNRANAEPLRRTDHAAGDLAPVGDEE